MRSHLLIFFFISDVESDLPEDLKNEASLRFQAAIDSHLPIGSATEKVQEEVLSKCNDVFKGKRYKGFIRFEYESNVITINVSNFFSRCELQAYYRVSHTYLTKVILLEMTLNCTAYLKSMHFCNHKDPPFDMKCQLMSADPLPAVKIDLKYIS